MNGLSLTSRGTDWPAQLIEKAGNVHSGHSE